MSKSKSAPKTRDKAVANNIPIVDLEEVDYEPHIAFPREGYLKGQELLDATKDGKVIEIQGGNDVFDRIVRYNWENLPQPKFLHGVNYNVKQRN